MFPSAHGLAAHVHVVRQIGLPDLPIPSPVPKTCAHRLRKLLRLHPGDYVAICTIPQVCPDSHAGTRRSSHTAYPHPLFTSRGILQPPLPEALARSSGSTPQAHGLPPMPLRVSNAPRARSAESRPQNLNIHSFRETSVPALMSTTLDRNARSFRPRILTQVDSHSLPSVYPCVYAR
jgi:hypothetical protein